MSVVGWIVLLTLVIPLLGILAWVLLEESVVHVPPGRLGLLLVRGKATETALPPGRHFLPAVRRRMVEEYPSVELAYRAGSLDRGEPQGDLDRPGPPLPVALGDGALAMVSYTVRFRLIPEKLRLVHERFGSAGLFGIVRDESSKTVAGVLGEPEVTADRLHGTAREACQDRLCKAVGQALDSVGIEVTGFVLGAVDLGRTGEVIQATIRARHELEQEKADAVTRLARALNDLDLQGQLSSPSETAWRYRETDVWRDLVQRTQALSFALRGGPGASTVTASGPTDTGTAAQQTAEPR